MVERIKIKSQDIGYDYDDGNGLCIDCLGVEKFEQLREQILNDHEKAEQRDKVVAKLAELKTTFPEVLAKAEKIDKITAFAKNLTYSNTHVSWQLKQLLKDPK